MPKEVVISSSDSPWSPDFIQDLLPSAQRTALLYHLSYLCLGRFPKLECLIREQAVETQMLFGSSEAVLLKCVGTSSNLVSSLFPILKKAVEKNKPDLAVKYLERARTWIDDIIKAVDDTVERYGQRSHNVGTCTSDVLQEQKQTDEKLKNQSDEIRALQDTLVKLGKDLERNGSDMEEMERKISKKSSELQEHLMKSSKKRYGFLRAIVPFFAIIHDAVTEPEIAAKTESLKSALSSLDSEKNRLRSRAWDIQIQQTDRQLQLANSKIKLGVIPSPVHLAEVQACLFQIQQILVSLKKFWEKVKSMLDTLKERTFIGDLFVEMDDMKEEFLETIEVAGKYWQTFGACCYKAQSIFSIQSKDAYLFLGTNPSSLSEEQRKRQYDSVLEKLRQISPQGSSTAAAITQ